MIGNPFGQRRFDFMPNMAHRFAPVHHPLEQLDHAANSVRRTDTMQLNNNYEFKGFDNNVDRRTPSMED